MSETHITAGELTQEVAPGSLTPWTFKGILAHGVVALVRIAAALERWEIERKREVS